MSGRWPRAPASNDPLAANDVYDPFGGVRANIRAHEDIQDGVGSVRTSRMDARGVIGLLHKSLGGLVIHCREYPT